MQSSVLDALLNTNAPIQQVNTPSSPMVSMNLTAPEHKGMFGMKGNLRNIIGALGDALAGNKYYAGTRQNEREQDAMINFAGNPLEAVRAMSQVNPARAMAMEENMTQREIARQKAEQETAYRQLQTEVIRDKGRGVLGSLAGAVESSSDPSKNYKAALPQFRAIASRYGIDVQLPEEYDKDQVGLLRYSGLTPDQGFDNERADELSESTLRDREVRQGIAREGLNVRKQQAANSSGNSYARLAETRRHNQVMEGLGQQRIDKPSTKTSTKAPAKYGLPKGFKIVKRIN